MTNADQRRTRQQYAERMLPKMGLQAGDLHFEIARDAMMRGWPAWRVAQYLDLKPELIEQLGGPKVSDG